MKRILLVDNYDSFVFNVLHLLRRVTGCETDICYNNKIPYSSLSNYSHIVLSPGPGVPSEAGDLLKVIEHCKISHSILGICLGHQAIAQYFGAELINLKHPLHGHKSTIKVIDTGCGVMGKMSREENSNQIKFEAALYHSWAVSMESVKLPLKVSSINESEIVMSLFHESLNIFGVQFHPESVITHRGNEVIKNWFDRG